MPSEESQDVKELRRQMREGRAPLLQAIREAYPPYLFARKGLERKNSEVRVQSQMNQCQKMKSTSIICLYTCYFVVYYTSRMITIMSMASAIEPSANSIPASFKRRIL